MSAFKNLKFGTKILLLGMGSVLITIVALVGTVVWQSAQFNALAQEQFKHAAEADLGNIAEGAYNTIEAQDQVVQEQVNSGLNVAQQLMHDAGGARLSDETVDWQATNDITRQTTNIQLPKMYVGDTWLGKMSGRYDTTPIVDHTQLIVGGNATIYQRMNEEGDMLRVATNVLLPNGQRAIGTYVPATNPDGTPNPAVAAALRNSVYRGSNFVIDAWYNTTSAPIRDESGQVIGMLQVGMKQENVDAARQAILRAKVGESGNIDVLGSEGNDRGRYIVSRKGQREGENVWNTQSADGSFPIQALIEKAVTLKFGQVAVERYQWQDPGDPTPRSKVAGVTYYEPWHWVIVASMDESEIQAYQRILEEGQTRMIMVASAVGVALALIAGFLSVLIARSIARPVIHLADVATQVSAGNLQVVATVEERDEIGTLAAAFNTMTGRLRDLIDSLETRVEMRTAQVEASADVGRAVTSILDPDQLLRQVVKLITDRFGFYYAAAFTIEPSGHWAVLREASGPSNAAWLLKQAGHRLELKGNSMVAACVRDCRARVALDTGVEAVRFANPLLPDTHSEVALPLKVGDQVLGALDVQSTQVAAFDETSTAVLQNMADQIAVALNNAAQYRTEQTRAQQTTYLLEATVELTTQSSVAGLNTRIIELTETLLRADCAALWLPINDTELELRTASGPLQPMIGQRLAIGAGVAGRVYATGLALRLDDTRTWKDSALDLGEALVRAALATPMVWQGQPMGVLVAAHTQPDKVFTDDDGNAAQLFAAQAAAAIENVQLLERLQRTLTELGQANKRLTGEAWQKRLRDNELVYQYQRTGKRDAMLPALSMTVPIELRGQSIGQVVVEDDQPQRRLSAEERELVQEVVGRMALALESARLFEQTQSALSEARRLAQRERLINRITAQLRGAATVDEVLRIAADEMRHSVGATYTSVKLTPPTGAGNGQGEEHDSK
jgi:GAF domain-containing protein/HAMP domain-containing protein